MTALTLSTGTTLVAAITQTEPGEENHRVAEGILVPWDEPGRTNLGRGVAVRRGAVTVPPRVIGTIGHNREAPVSRLIAHEDRPEGLWGRMRIAETPAGDLLLAELRAGIRDGLSVELDVTDRDTAGHVTAGRLDYVAHLPVGAFDSAGVHALAATVNTDTGDNVTAPAPAPVMSQEQFTQLLAALQPAVHAAGGEPSAAALLGTGNAPAAPQTMTAEVDPLEEAARLSAAIHNVGGTDQTLIAALADITASGLPLFQQGASRLGEKLWEGAAYNRQFVQLMRGKPLTAMRYYGWRWINRPKMDAWSGDKTEVPTGPVSLEQVPFDARRAAGGWDVDRKYKDFGDTEFWTEFYTAQTESYQELSDTWAAEGIVDAALDVSDDANLATLPADYAALVDATGVEAGPTQILRAAAIGRVILMGTPRVKQGPDYVLVNPIDWLTLADLAALDLPAFLALLKVNPESFIPTIQVPQGQVILGVRNAMTYRELGGGSPIRVEALDVARGGIDSAVYGYVGISQERPGGVISVPLAAAV
jgi:hypothetical protein